MRRTLDKIDADRQGMILALYSNGMIGGNDLTREITSINNRATENKDELLRTMGLLSDEEEGEDTFDMNPPLLAKVSPDAD